MTMASNGPLYDQLDQLIDQHFNEQVDFFKAL